MDILASKNLYNNDETQEFDSNACEEMKKLERRKYMKAYIKKKKNLCHLNIKQMKV